MSNTHTRDRTAADLLRHYEQPLIEALHEAGATISNPRSILCPFHEDHTPSGGLYRGDDGAYRYKCQACEVGGDLFDIRALVRGTTVAEELRAVSTASPTDGKATHQHGRIVATYDYCDAEGTLLFQVVRYDPKDFRQRVPNGNGGWTWKLGDTPLVLYRLPQIIEANKATTIFICEGEKDVDRLAAEGIVATTCPQGAGKWGKLADASAIHGRRVAILPDNDPKGHDHADQVAAALHGKAASVCVVVLPDLPNKGDVSDWLNAGGTGEALLALARDAEQWKPTACSADPSMSGEEEIGEVGRDRLAWTPYPTDALPDAIRRFTSTCSKSIGCDESFIAVPAIACMAAAIGNHRSVQIKRGWTEPSVLWTVIVGESGSSKSPAFKTALKAVREAQSHAIREHASACERYEVEKANYEKLSDQWKRGGSGPAPEKPQPPQPTRYVVADTTVEALAPLLQSNPRGLLLARDELSGWLGAMDRYAAARGGDAAAWLSIHGAEQLIVDRKTAAGPIFVPRAAVSITGGIQPGILAKALGQDHRENGMAARLLLTMPPRKAKTWQDSDIPPAVEAEFALIVDQLLGLQGNVDAETGEVEPVVVSLAPEAKKAFVDFYNAHAKEQAALTGDLAAAWSKLEGYVPRLALVLHFAKWAAGENVGEAIGASTINEAIRLVRWHANEAKRVYSRLSETEDDRELRHMVELLQAAGGSITGSELVRQSRQFRTVSDAEAALEKLVTAGLGDWKYPPQRGRGRPGAKRMTLKTSVYEKGDKSTVYDVNENENRADDSASGNIVDVDIVDTSETGNSIDGDDDPFVEV